MPVQHNSVTTSRRSVNAVRPPDANTIQYQFEKSEMLTITMAVMISRRQSLTLKLKLHLFDLLWIVVDLLYPRQSTAKSGWLSPVHLYSKRCSHHYNVLTYSSCSKRKPTYLEIGTVNTSYRNVILTLLSVHLSTGVSLRCNVYVTVIALFYLHARLLREFWWSISSTSGVWASLSGADIYLFICLFIHSFIHFVCSNIQQYTDSEKSNLRQNQKIQTSK